MSNRIRKTEHAGAKNGGGYWGKRHEAKSLSRKIRRAESRRLAESESSQFESSITPSQRMKSDEETSED